MMFAINCVLQLGLRTSQVKDEQVWCGKFPIGFRKGLRFVLVS